MALYKIVVKEKFDNGMWELKTYLVEATDPITAKAVLNAHRTHAGGTLATTTEIDLARV